MASPSSTTATLVSAESHSSLAARLKLDGESANCWDSFEPQACTGEVIMFFLNGETYLGPSCCQVKRIVGHDNWPNMLASMGFISEDGDVLQGYCDAEQEQTHSPPSPSSPTTVFHDVATKMLP
ncbi:Egg cell-secreted protein 1.1 [Spatholobus suberectus]|nr:Egg cell-secreted protein 1.1 [Spatholobus suberectus]